MSDDLITSLRALAAARHDDLSIAVDAVIEIERLREENERLRNEDTKTRHALKGWVFVCPDGGDEPTHERVAAVVAEVDRLRADLATQQGCCDGAAAQDAHIRREREEHKAEVERLTGKLKLVADALNETISKYHEVGDQNDRLDAENERLTRERDEARYFLKIFLHAHASNNAVPPHLEEQARKALEGEP
ncbi:MAG: hypothetical protein KJS95_11265 [Gammaproteobacteria bacterium]|nr:hypothetical protein [Gammaproteobacteria bacterium]